MADAQPPYPPAQPPFQPVGPQPMGPAVAKMPSAAGYFIGAAVMVLAAIAGMVLLVNGFSSVAHAFSFPERVQSGGAIEISSPGPYIVYEIQPDPGAFEPTKTTSVTVTDPAGNVKYAGVYGGSRTSSSGFEEAVAVVTFSADTTGTYHVTATNLPPGHTLGVGDGQPVKTNTIAYGFVVGGLGFLIGLAVIIVTATRRYGAKPRPVMPPFGGVPGAPYPQGMPPGTPPGPQEWWHQQGPPSGPPG